MSQQRNKFEVSISGLELPEEVAKRLESEIKKTALREIANMDTKGDLLIRDSLPPELKDIGGGTRGIWIEYPRGGDIRNVRTNMPDLTKATAVSSPDLDDVLGEVRTIYEKAGQPWPEKISNISRMLKSSEGMAAAKEAEKKGIDWTIEIGGEVDPSTGKGKITGKLVIKF